MARQLLRVVMYIVVLSFCLTCGGRQLVRPEPINAIEVDKSVLIVTRTSVFKDRIVKKLIQTYRDRALITLVDLDDLDDIQITEYDAMVVMGARMGFLLLSAKEKRFLKRLEEPEKLILVMTASKDDWKWDREDIDVISCASEFKNVDPLYQKIAARLDKILIK